MPYVLLHEQEVMDQIRSMPDNSVDAIVTDPPYGLGKEPDAIAMLQDWMEAGTHQPKSTRGFMGKSWDAFVPQPQQWRECLRVLKPGGHLLAFAGTRTQDLMTLGLRLAGFEIRDLVAWIYGSGFPKSHNLDGEREGWGTALKPALEPLTMARKPLEGTVAQNVLKWQTGAINIDACRVHSQDSTGYEYTVKRMAPGADQNKTVETHQGGALFNGHTKNGRWPANVIHDGSEAVVSLFPQSSMTGKRSDHSRSAQVEGTTWGTDNHQSTEYTDSGSASRFFYCAKPSKTDRNGGCDALPDKQWANDGACVPERNNRPFNPSKNNHPTVKPTELMRYLCRLITPPGGIILDPFMGSGSTGRAAMLEGFRFIGIEKEAEYLEIARARIEHAAHPSQINLAL